MTRTIVCAIEDSDRARVAARVAADLAGRLGASLVAAHAVPPPMVTTAGLPYPAPPRVEPIEDAHHAALERARDALVAAGLPDARVRAAYGSVPDVLVKVAAEEDAVMLALAADDYGALRTVLNGSATGALLRSATLPVLAVPPAAGARPADGAPGPVLAAVRSPRDAAWIPVAERLARVHTGELVLVHVLEEGEAEASSRFDAFGPALDALRGAATRIATRVCFGEPGEALVRVAAESGAGLLVTGSRGHGAVRAALTGSTARRLVRDADTPVVVCPPGSLERSWTPPPLWQLRAA